MRSILVLLASATLCGCGTPYTLGQQANGDPLSLTTAAPKKVTQVNEGGIEGDKPLTSLQARELADQLLNKSDVYCQNYLVGLSVENNTIAASLDFAALTLSSISPLTKPAANAAIVSASSAVAGGTKHILSTDILGGKDYGLIYDAVIDGRAADRKKIQTEIDVDKFNGWTADTILAHMQPYHYNCGIEYGLKYLRETLATQSQKPTPTNSDSTTAKVSADQASQTAAAKADSASKAYAAAKANADSLKKAADQADQAAKAATGKQNADALQKQASQADQKANDAESVAAKLSTANDAAQLAAQKASDAAKKADDAATADLEAKVAASKADDVVKGVASN